MSGLSKVFVGLLIVLSLLLSSATIVWVNKTEDFKLAAKNADEKLRAAEKAKVDASAETDATKTAYQNAIKSFGTQIEQLQSDIKAKDQEISKREVQIADLASQTRQNAIALTSTGEALKASEAQKKLQLEQLADLRATNEKIQKEKSELNMALSDTTNKLDVMNREWKFMKEQLAESQNSADKLTRQVKDLGGNPAAQVAGVKAGAPAINGVIREVKTLDDNRPWATISVGSADSVQKGMEFKVIDRSSGSFLGILTVQGVEPNQAVGVLAGPKVPDIKAGNEVRTQL